MILAAPDSSRDNPPVMRTIAVIASLAVAVIAWLSYGSLGANLDIPNEKTWTWAFYSLVICVGGMAAALWFGLPSQHRVYGLALLLLTAILATLRGCAPATGGIAGLVVLEVFVITALAIARYMGFTWRRIGRGLFSILLAGGLVAIAALPLAVVSLLMFGWGQLHSILVPVLVVLVVVVGAGGLAGLWILESKATATRWRSNWRVAAGGFATGAAVSYFSLATANFENAPSYFGLWFCALAGFALAAATLAGYSLRAGDLRVGPLPDVSRFQ